MKQLNSIKKEMKGIKSFIMAIIIICLMTSCSSINRISSPLDKKNGYPIAKNGLWGYADAEGELVIDYQFESADFFSSGLAGVKKDGKYGFINRIGEFEIKPKFDSINSFGLEKAFVSKKARSFWINRKGKKLKLKEGIIIGSCGTGQAIVLESPNEIFKKVNNRYQLVESQFKQQQRLDPRANYTIEDFTFDEIIPFSHESIIVKKNNKYGIYVHFNWVGLVDFWFDEIHPFYGKESSNDILYEAYRAKFRIGDKWGLISKMGKIELEQEFYNIVHALGIFYLVEYKPDHWGHMTLRNRYF